MNRVSYRDLHEDWLMQMGLFETRYIMYDKTAAPEFFETFEVILDDWSANKK